MRQPNPVTQSINLVQCAVGLFSLLSLMAKILGTDTLGTALHPMQISAARFIVAFLCLASVFIIKPIPLGGAPWGLHVKRSMAGWGGATCLFAAVSLMPMADANAISFLSVIVSMCLSIWILREKAGPRRWVAALIALLGALLITRPGTTAFQPAALIALLAAAFIGIELVFIKKLSGIEPVLRILLINNAVGATISILVLGFVWQTPTAAQWLLMLLIGSLMVVAQSANILAMQRGDASFIAPFWYAMPLFTAILDYLVFGQVVTFISGTGITLIIAAGIFITWREQKVQATAKTD